MASALRHRQPEPELGERDPVSLAAPEKDEESFSSNVIMHYINTTTITLSDSTSRSKIPDVRQAIVRALYDSGVNDYYDKVGKLIDDETIYSREELSERIRKLNKIKPNALRFSKQFKELIIKYVREVTETRTLGRLGPITYYEDGTSLADYFTASDSVFSLEYLIDDFINNKARDPHILEMIDERAAQARGKKKG